MPSWHLDDPRATAASHKYTFYLPSSEVISRVSVGEVVKLIFCFESEDPEAPRAERMWVLIDRIDGSGGFSGRLDNEPRHIRDIKADDPVDFQSYHIIATEHDEEDNIVERYFPRCLVTKRILDDGAKVRYLYRESTDKDDDSGWRILAGDESDEYMDDPNNSACVSLGAVLNRDDSFIHLLEAPVGAAFERGKFGEEFVAVRDGG
jgi:hypothetical protein